MGRIRVSPDARRDLIEIYLFIAQDNLAAAGRVHAQIERAFQTILSQPLIGRIRDELAAGIRSFPVGSYLIYYRATSAKDYVRILRVLHGARDIERLFK